MKILSLSSTADLSGASRCMERALGRLVEDGHEIHVGVPARGTLTNVLAARGIVVHVVPGLHALKTDPTDAGVGWMKLALAAPRAIWTLTRLIRRLNVDLVHTNELLLPSPSVAAHLTRRPHVWHVRSVPDRWKDGQKRAYLRWVSASSTSIIANSQYLRRQFAARSQHRIDVVYEGIVAARRQADQADVQAFRRRFPQATHLVGVVGRIEWNRRGQEMLVRAASLLRPRMPGVHYIFAGRADAGQEHHEAYLRELVKTYGLEDVITFVGPKESPRTVVAALDLAVVPPVSPQSFSLSALNAMAEGVCVVGSRGGGIPEEIQDGETGVLFTPGDFAELATCLERLLKDEASRRRMGEAGRELVAREFTFEQTMEGLKRVLARTLPR